MSDLPDVVIVGGGILGTALAYELTRRTLRVTVLEAGGLARGATGNGFAWVNATSKTEDARYHALNVAGMNRYRDLAAEWGAEALGLHGGGSLAWKDGADPEGILKQRQLAGRLQSLGYPVALLNQLEMQALEPCARFSDGAEGLYAPTDKWVDTIRLSRFFVDRASEKGGVTRRHCHAVDFALGITGSISMVHTSEEPIATRNLVLAAGVVTPELVRQLTRRMDPASMPVVPVYAGPGLLVEAPSVLKEARVGRVLFPPDRGGLHLRPTFQDGLLLAADDLDAQVPPGEEPQPPADAVRRLLLRASAAIPGIGMALSTPPTPRICMRPMPSDGLPIVGALPGVRGVYVAVTHSGITLGPLLAQLLADQIVNGRVPDLLKPYTPARFSKS